VPPEWFRTAQILKSKPGQVLGETVPDEDEVYPVLHCSQEIPCNPCTSVCSQGAIFIDEQDIRNVPDYIARKLGTTCIACEKCVTVCPGLAITLVDLRKANGSALVTIPYEFGREAIHTGDLVTVTDTNGQVLGDVEVVRVRSGKTTDRTVLVKVRAPREIANLIAGIQVQELQVGEPLDQYVERLTDDMIVCRCERVSLAEIKSVIQSGVRDMNEIKALTRAGMGACGSKTCSSLIERAFKELGVSPDQITPNVSRPLFIEVPLGILARSQDNS
jgi:sarcosine oxidase, subunit alpha